MADQIILNNEIYHFTEDNLPCLIHYAPKAGGSHFSVTMVADLFLRGSKILFLTAYPMAKDNFFEQIKGMESQTSYVTSSDQLDANAQAIILESGNERLFLEAVKTLPDILERILLVKNMEVFGQTVFDACLNHPRLILSGNIDTCLAKKQISEKSWKSIVLFTKPLTPLRIEPPILEKYIGYFWNESAQGLIAIQKA
ncbi:MAG: hypothetical protein V1778_03590 [bacterium]